MGKRIAAEKLEAEKDEIMGRVVRLTVASKSGQSGTKTLFVEVVQVPFSGIMSQFWNIKILSRTGSN